MVTTIDLRTDAEATSATKTVLLGATESVVTFGGYTIAFVTSTQYTNDLIYGTIKSYQAVTPLKILPNVTLAEKNVSIRAWVVPGADLHWAQVVGPAFIPETVQVVVSEVVESKAGGRDVTISDYVMGSCLLASESWLPSGIGDKAQKTNIWKTKALIQETVGPSVSPQAGERLRGYEHLMHEVYAIVREEVRKQGTLLQTFVVQPDWSNEYDESTGVVVDIEIRGTAENRFAIWDGIASRLEELEGTLTPNDYDFLTRNVSVVVSRE